MINFYYYLAIATTSSMAGILVTAHGGGILQAGVAGGLAGATCYALRWWIELMFFGIEGSKTAKKSQAEVD